MQQQEQVISLPKVSVRDSKIHGLGLFVDEEIKKGALVAEYKGEIISGEEGDKRSIEDDNPFIMCFDDERDIDGDCEENLARFVNHSCSSNVTFELREEKMWCIAIKDIAPGEELTTDYEMDCHELLPCACGHDICRHYMNHPEDIETLKKEAEAEMNRLEAERKESQ